MQEVTPDNENEEILEAVPVDADDQFDGETDGEEEEITVLSELNEENEDEDEDDEDEMDEELAEALDRVAHLEQENKALKTRVLRAQADMENYRKRSEREKLDSIKFANKRIFLEILDVIDNFNRALTAVTDPKDNFVIGVNMIHKQLMDVLTQNGVEVIDSMGRPFDPYLDEALAKEITTEHEENMVVEVFQQGFRFQGTLLRPSKVKVAAAPEEEEPETETETESEPEASAETDNGETNA